MLIHLCSKLTYNPPQKGLMKGEELTVLDQTTQLTHKHSYYWLPSESLWKKLPRRLNLLNGSQLHYKTITCEKKKNSAFCLILQGNPAIASSKEQLYEQMTSNPAFTERNIQKANAYLLSSGAKIFGHVSHSTELVRMCLACQHFDFDCADWIFDNLHVISSRYLQTMGKEFIFQLSRCSWGRNAWQTPKNACVGGYYFP